MRGWTIDQRLSVSESLTEGQLHCAKSFTSGCNSRLHLDFHGGCSPKNNSQNPQPHHNRTKTLLIEAASLRLFEAQLHCSALSANQIMHELCVGDLDTSPSPNQQPLTQQYSWS